MGGEGESRSRYESEEKRDGCEWNAAQVSKDITMSTYLHFVVAEQVPHDIRSAPTINTHIVK